MKNSSLKGVLGPPVKRQFLQKKVYQRLRRSILNGKLEPGTQIKIGELAENLNVSANPVREALRHLEAEGMVNFQPNKRITVNKLSREDVHDIYSILNPLEQIALEKCFKSLNPSNLDALKEIYQKTLRGDIGKSQWIEFNWQFHHKIHELTGSPRLIKIIGTLRYSIEPYFHFVMKHTPRIKEANREHELILEALEKKDYSGAKKALRRHLANGAKSIDNLLKKENDSVSSGLLDIL